jgi:hypothetical protein
VDINRVVPEMELVAQILEVLRGINPDGAIGGITIGKPGRPRAMIYVGQCPINPDVAIRNLAKRYGYNVSPVRTLAGLASIATATRDDPKGY